RSAFFDTVASPLVSIAGVIVDDTTVAEGDPLKMTGLLIRVKTAATTNEHATAMPTVMSGVRIWQTQRRSPRRRNGPCASPWPRIPLGRYGERGHLDSSVAGAGDRSRRRAGAGPARLDLPAARRCDGRDRWPAREAAGDRFNSRRPPGCHGRFSDPRGDRGWAGDHASGGHPRQRSVAGCSRRDIRGGGRCPASALDEGGRGVALRVRPVYIRYRG